MSAVRRYFGTDGVRGPYGGPLMNEAFARRLGAAAGRWLKEQGSAGGKILIGRDTRASGLALGQAVAEGFATEGFPVHSLAVLPTPAVALAVRERQAALGVVVTASHNPAADNGIKFFGPAGMKLTDEEELAIERLLPGERAAEPLALPVIDAAADYVQRLNELVLGGDLAGWRLVLDTANGATVRTSAEVLRHRGVELLRLGAEPDGHNINDGVGSEHPEKLSEAVLRHGAKLGIAHDGDGDRCVLCDERGGVLDGDEILTILALHALREGRLEKNLLVVTVQSNLGVDAAVGAAGGRVLRTGVGDRYVIERMRAEGALLGGESSGHIICADVAPTGDGLVAALKVLEVMLATGRPLSELRRSLRKFPQLTAALKVREKKPLEGLSLLRREIAAIESELGSRGRVLVRYSGTEPKLRLLVEGPTDEIVKGCLDRLATAVGRELDVLG